MKIADIRIGQEYLYGEGYKRVYNKSRVKIKNKLYNVSGKYNDNQVEYVFIDSSGNEGHSVRRAPTRHIKCPYEEENARIQEAQARQKAQQARLKTQRRKANKTALLLRAICGDVDGDRSVWSGSDGERIFINKGAFEILSNAVIKAISQKVVEVKDNESLLKVMSFNKERDDDE